MISEKELAVLTEVQNLPLTSEPFSDIGGRLGISETEVFDICNSLISNGIIRRFGPSISHRKIGMSANPMTVLNVPEDKLEEVGLAIAESNEVTHCYVRTGWKYNLFFMIHGKTRDEAEEKVKKILEKIDVDDYKLLYSIRELKKISFELPKSDTGGSR